MTFIYVQCSHNFLSAVVLNPEMEGHTARLTMVAVLFTELVNRCVFVPSHLILPLHSKKERHSHSPAILVPYSTSSLSKATIFETAADPL
jgi:hypothetical protein